MHAMFRLENEYGKKDFTYVTHLVYAYISQDIPFLFATSWMQILQDVLPFPTESVCNEKIITGASKCYPFVKMLH